MSSAIVRGLIQMKVLLCSTYELGHQPLALAQPAAQLLASGFDVQCRDLAVQSLERAVVEWADVVGISIPMFTAIRLGVKLGDQIKTVNPRAHVTYFGLYASLNAQYLFEKGADSVVGGEFEGPMVNLVRRLARGEPANAEGSIEGVQLVKEGEALPFLGRQQFVLPARHLLPPLERYSYLEWGEVRKVSGYVEASRGCAHKCLHCPIPAVYEGGSASCRRTSSSRTSPSWSQWAPGTSTSAIRISSTASSTPCGWCAGCTSSSRTSPSTSPPRSSTWSSTRTRSWSWAPWDVPSPSRRSKPSATTSWRSWRRDTPSSTCGPPSGSRTRRAS